MHGRFVFTVASVVTLGCAGTGGRSEPAAPIATGPLQTPTPAAGAPGLQVLETPVSFTVVEGSVPDDTAVDSLVASFRSRMAEEIQQVIGETTGMLSKAVPEGTLGNFATDAMLWAANQGSREPVDMALTNNGGLRVPIAPGPITVGKIYELMPFENMLSILVLSGSQVQNLCDQLAEARGEPIAGFTFRIVQEGDRRVARDIEIGGIPLDPARRYRLVTNDYLANGGDSLSQLHDPLSREDLPILLRDAFIGYVRQMGTIRPALEGRITGGIGS
jgi:2',3'-cyclic-nucleotide 2'-phosphodiesterase (5'-nucleotidase family)